MADVHLKFVDYATMKIVADPSIVMDISEHLTFFKQNYKFDKRFKNRMWDGKIRLVNRLTATTYAGLAQTIKKFCDTNGYTLTFDPEYQYNDISEQDIRDFIGEMNLPEWVEVRDYQVEAIHKCVVSNRRTLVSPTSCHGKGELIWTTNGLTPVEHIVVGDMVYGANGEPRAVLATTSGTDVLYKIIPNKKYVKPIVVTGEHIVPLWDGSKKTYMSAEKLFSLKSTRGLSMYVNDVEHIDGADVQRSLKIIRDTVNANPHHITDRVVTIFTNDRSLKERVAQSCLISGLIPNTLGDRVEIRGKLYKLNLTTKRTYLPREVYRTGFRIAQLGVGEYYGLQVQDRHYLTESGVVTHNSGKSFMIYAITQWYKKKALIIVPSTGLVAQMRADIESFGYQGRIHTSLERLSDDNDIDADIVITTWQSINNGKVKKPDEWFLQFEVVFGDEAHGCKAPTLISICSALKNAKYRFGTTGTLDQDPLNRQTIFGLFGPPFKSISTRELIDQGFATDVEIKCVVLKYSSEICKKFHEPIYDKILRKKRKRNYQEEVEFITSLPERTEFIAKMVDSLQGNKIVFFRYTDHGENLRDRISQVTGKPTYYIDGSVDTDSREQMRTQMEMSDVMRLTFGDKVVVCARDVTVPLSSGETKCAKDITINDDVDDQWIVRMAR